MGPQENGAWNSDRSTAVRLQIVSPVSWVVLSIIGILALGVAATSVYLPGAMKSAAIDAAYRANLEVADLIKIARGYYTQNVVAKVERSGALTASFGHKDDPNAVPLPATFVKDISALLQERATSLSLVSPYPWPHRADRKMDDFETTAWTAFQKDPAAIFSRHEMKDGQRVLRVAVADRMTTTTCVNCHNSDPQSAKHDWKVGDVRAVMQVTRVVEPYLAAVEQRSRMILWTLGAAACAAALTLLAVTFLVERRTREKRTADRHLAFLAHHDALTGLPNRVLFRDRLDRGLAATNQRGSLSVLFLDLDGFKDINDVFGHSAGDALLKAVSVRLRNCVEMNDTVARWGGDEFVILHVTDGQDDQARIAERIIESMKAPFEIDDHQVTSGASIGISMSPADGKDPDKLLKNADLAAYHAKSESRGGYRFFNPDMDASVSERRKLEQELRDALATSEFEIHYQPIVKIETRQKVAMEALVRWRHPQRGLIPPDKFIPLAEETGLIKQLGELVLRRACADAACWPSHLKVAVNLSPVQFESPDLADDVARILAASGLPSGRLELEITESVLLTRSSQNIATLHRLHDLGISIALDDFGTGYSSLSYLHTFPFDKIKIDRSFVSEMSERDTSAAIVCAVANLGRSLDIVTTAEGVETEEQLSLLQAAGCTQAQGYLLGRPAPVADVDFEEDFITAPNHEADVQSSSYLTVKDVMLVRNSFSLVVPIQNVAADLFYDRLFVIAPELRSLFPDDLSEQKNKLMSMLGTGIAKLHDLSTLAPVLKNLGARHMSFGTTTEHYSIVGEALLWTLQEGLGDAFTPKIRTAWTKVYDLLASTMQSGAAEAAAARAA